MQSFTPVSLSAKIAYFIQTKGTVTVHQLSTPKLSGVMSEQNTTVRASFIQKSTAGRRRGEVLVVPLFIQYPVSKPLIQEVGDLDSILSS